MRVWLAKDPESGRITAQNRPITREDLPRGARGEGWERREIDVPQVTFTKVLHASYSGEAVDRIHLRWWQDGTCWWGEEGA